jgi:Ion channel
VIGAVLLYLNINIDAFFVGALRFCGTARSQCLHQSRSIGRQSHCRRQPDLFQLVTLTSVGYGDIVPLHPVVRGIANVEAIVGQLHPAALLARLRYVSLLTENSSVIRLWQTR